MTSPAKPPKTHVPEIRLAKLANAPGGRRREDAIAAANTRVESLRDDGIDGIASALDELESIVRAASQGNVSSEQIVSIQALADRIITLAGTFGFQRLDEVARSLVDLTKVLIEASIGPAGPILVHVRAARLFAPNAEVVPDDLGKKVLSELKKVFEHFSGPKA